MSSQIWPSRRAAVSALPAALPSNPAAARVYGPVDECDVVDDIGQESCGFEIELEGVHSSTRAPAESSRGRLPSCSGSWRCQPLV